jgi:hypothetical protein
MLPVSGFPIPQEELNYAAVFLENFTIQSATRWRLSSEVFLQLEQLNQKEARASYVKNSRTWIPEVGLGVWPDREPPAAWSKDEFLEAAPGEKIRPVMYQVFRITAPQPHRENARRILLGFGPILEVLTSEDGEVFLNRATTVLLPAISDPSYTCFPFYVPLLEGKTLTSAAAALLEAWFCGATIYIRESFEDKGILIASREPLTPILEELGGRFEEKPEPVWRIPIE